MKKTILVLLFLCVSSFALADCPQNLGGRWFCHDKSMPRAEDETADIYDIGVKSQICNGNFETQSSGYFVVSFSNSQSLECAKVPEGSTYHDIVYFNRPLPWN